MGLNKEQELERTIYQLVAVTCFFALIFMSWKYIELKNAYQKAETSKVTYCIENAQLRRDLVAAEYEAEKLFDIGLEDK